MRLAGRAAVMAVVVGLLVAVNYHERTISDRVGTTEISPFFEWKLYPVPSDPETYRAPRALDPDGVDLGLRLAPHLTKEETYSLLRSIASTAAASPELAGLRFGCLLELDQRPAGTYVLVRRTVDGYEVGSLVEVDPDDVVLEVSTDDHEPDECEE